MRLGGQHLYSPTEPSQWGGPTLERVYTGQELNNWNWLSSKARDPPVSSLVPGLYEHAMAFAFHMCAGAMSTASIMTEPSPQSHGIIYNSDLRNKCLYGPGLV